MGCPPPPRKQKLQNTTAASNQCFSETEMLFSSTINQTVRVTPRHPPSYTFRTKNQLCLLCKRLLLPPCLALQQPARRGFRSQEYFLQFHRSWTGGSNAL